MFYYLNVHDIDHIAVMITGITGAGKSSACNFLLGEKIFEVGVAGKAVRSQSGSYSTVLNGRKLEIIDSASFREDGENDEENINELCNAIFLARNGIHAIALVVNVSRRFACLQVALLKELELLGELWPFMFIIFSAAKHCGDTDEEQRKRIFELYNTPVDDRPENFNKNLKEKIFKILLDKVEKRFIMLECTETNQDYRTSKLREFFKMVDGIYHTNERLYSNKLFKQAIELYEERRIEKAYQEDESQYTSEELEKDQGFIALKEMVAKLRFLDLRGSR